MRKQLITVFLLLIWLCQLSGRYFVVLEFYLNQEYIAKNLCINRNKPEMHCNGQCHLKKKLTEEDKQNQENPERRGENKSEHFYPGLAQITLTPSCVTVNNELYLPLTIGIPVDYSYTIFHPPAA